MIPHVTPLGLVLIAVVLLGMLAVLVWGGLEERQWMRTRNDKEPPPN